MTTPALSSVLRMYQSTDTHTVLMVVLFVCAHSVHGVVCAVSFLAAPLWYRVTLRVWGGCRGVELKEHGAAKGGARGGGARGVK